MMSSSAILDTITALRHQEERGYSVPDYLHQDEDQKKKKSWTGPLNRQTAPSNDGQLPAPLVDASCRTKMVEWCMRVVDYCQFSHESVVIAMNLLDRYMATRSARKTKATSNTHAYQLAVMACLYTSIKIHEPQAMTPAILSNISKGVYTPKEIETMELEILMALKFRVNPPTAHSYVRSCLELMVAVLDERPGVGIDMDEYTVETLYDFAKIQIEAAIAHYSLARVPASTLAFCALRNALKATHYSREDAALLLQFLSRALFGKEQPQEEQRRLVAKVKSQLNKMLVRQTVDETMLRLDGCSSSSPLSTRGRSRSRRSKEGSWTPQSASGRASPRSAVTTDNL